MGSGQRGCFGTGLKIIAVLMVIGLILSLPLALAGRSFGRVLFKPGVLSSILQSQVLESGMVEVALRENLFTRDMFEMLGSEGDDIGRYFAYLSPAEREEIFYTLIPPDWIKGQVTGILRGLYDWLDNDQPAPKLVIELAPLKTNLLHGGLSSFMDIVIDSWPSCKPEQVEGLQQAFFEGGRLPEEVCEPPEPLRSRVVDLATIAFEQQVAELPAMVSLVERSTSPLEIAAMKAQVQLIRALMLWGWMLPVSLMGLIMAFVIRSWTDLGRWWGTPLILGGFGTSLLAFMLVAIRERVVADWVRGIKLGPAFEDILGAVFAGLYSAGLRPLWMQSLLLMLVGFVLWWVGRRALKKRVEEDAVIPRDQVDTKILPSSSAEDEMEEQGEPPSGIFG